MEKNYVGDLKITEVENGFIVEIINYLINRASNEYEYKKCWVFESHSQVAKFVEHHLSKKAYNLTSD